MIVRDEEARLARCLESVRPFVDEVCVLDTGSSDATLRIAEKYGARVQSVAWNDSFAEARNASLAMATGDWILVLDADEVLVASTGEQLRRIAQRGDIGGALLDFRHASAAGVQHGWLMRFFRNAPEHRYVGTIHEQLGPAFEEGLRARGQGLLMSSVLIDHDGYLPEVAQAKGKQERNARLLRIGVEREPDNAYLWFKYADFLRGGDDKAATLAAFERVGTLIASFPVEEAARLAWCGEAIALWALELLGAGRADEACEALDRSLGRYPETAHFHFVRAQLHLQSGEYEQALNRFNDCRSTQGALLLQAPAPGIMTWRSALGRAEALAGLGRRDDAIQVLEDAERAEPDCLDLVLARVDFLHRTGNLCEAIASCTAGLRRATGSAELWSRAGDLLGEAGLGGQASAAHERAQRLRA